MAAKKSQSSNTGSDNTVACAVLSYFLVGIIWYLADDAMKKSKLVQRHARQGTVLLLSWIVLAFILGMIPVIGWLILVVLQIAYLILWVLGIIHAATRKDEALPVIGHFAEKLTF